MHVSNRTFSISFVWNIVWFVSIEQGNSPKIINYFDLLHKNESKKFVFFSNYGCNYFKISKDQNENFLLNFMLLYHHSHISSFAPDVLHLISGSNAIKKIIRTLIKSGCYLLIEVIWRNKDIVVDHYLIVYRFWRKY